MPLVVLYLVGALLLTWHGQWPACAFRPQCQMRRRRPCTSGRTCACEGTPATRWPVGRTANTIKAPRQEVWQSLSTMARSALFLGFVVAVAAVVGVSTSDVPSSEDLVSSVMDDCLSFDGLPMSCLRLKVLSYLDGLTGQQGRSLSEQQQEADAERLDAMIATRVQRFVDTHQFKVQLPEFLFQSAELTFRPGKELGDFDITFPEPNAAEERSISEGKFAMKQLQYLTDILKPLSRSNKDA